MSRWRIWYDDQCEICQASLVWLRLLDPDGRVDAVGISACLDGATARPAKATDDDLLRQLHAEAPDGRVLTGAEALAALAREFRAVAWLGWLAQRPGLRQASARLYAWVARHRYSLSRCRGGACRAARVDVMRQKAAWRAFQACRVVGWTLIAPLSAALWLGRLARQAGRGCAPAAARPRCSTGACQSISSAAESAARCRCCSVSCSPRFGIAHCWSIRAAAACGARWRVTCTRFPPGRCATWRPRTPTRSMPATWTWRCDSPERGACPRAVPMLKRPWRIPWMRNLVIGQPPPVTSPIEPLDTVLPLDDATQVWVLPTPGHCDEHVAFYAPADRLLLIGDGFMGAHFSSPNEDVDHHLWIASLERLLDLEIEIMVEGHGHVHTRRADVIAELERQGFGELASHQDPRELLAEKLDFLRWVAEQVARGEAEGLPAQAIQATIFPWTQRWSYASVLQDKLATAVSLGGFGRHKVVRSFRRPSLEGDRRLPTVYELRWKV